MMNRPLVMLILVLLSVTVQARAEQLVEDDAVHALSAEVARLGWVVYGARSDQGGWDLFCCRPNGSDIHQLTRTAEFSEFSPQVSRDGRRLLYRRVPRDTKIDNNQHGQQGELVVADSDGAHPEVLGAPGAYTWASWSPDGRQIACLSIKGVAFIDLATRQEIRRLPRKGFFQQMTWSPDGHWLIGVANSFGVSWSIGRMNVETGDTSAVHRVDCCTPDWFPDSQHVIFSWRPPDQKSNPGYGWTQLWRTDAEGKSPQLVYGEDGRHVYGGCVSPDGKYVLFTGNMQEDGDPGHAGAPMGLMRLSDGPIIGGESKELRAVHPQTNNGPVLALPDGWEPCWTASEILADQHQTAPKQSAAPAVDREDAAGLARELRECGWIVFSARNENDRDDWDLFLMRPDGSDRRRITDTPGWNEAGARFARDGTRLLYYRMPKAEAVDNNTYGTYELVLADAEGGHADVWGTDYPWASWGPDGKQLACLLPQGIRIYDIATRQLVQQLPRQGIVQQLVWSPDGQAFVGTANKLGPYWNIGALDRGTGEMRLVSESNRYNCTADWCPDAVQIVYARGIVPPDSGRAELWAAKKDGTSQRMLYADAGFHVYGACPSPDGKYVLFTRSVTDLGQVDNSGTALSVIRWGNTPMVNTLDEELRTQYPEATRGPRLDLGPGWEPHWTDAHVAPETKGTPQ
jgi:Tol biopolymer transport system component